MLSGQPSYLSRDVSHMVSETTLARAQYSASVEDLVTTMFFGTLGYGVGAEKAGVSRD